MKKRTVFVVFAAVMIMVCGVFLAYRNTNYYYSRLLIKAISVEDTEEVLELIEEKPQCVNTYPSITSKWWHSAMNWRICYPLNEACSTGNIELIKLLIENGADVNCNDGLTPLSITYSAKVDNWYEISLILIENGASLDYSTEYSGDESSVLRDIVQHRSGGNAPDYIPEKSKEVILAFNYALENCDHNNVNWMRVIQHSVSNDRIEIVKLLLDQKYCDVNDMSVGTTALMFAARDSSPEMVQLLLDYGADKSIKTSGGKTALDYALESGNEDMIALLSDTTSEK